MLRTFCLILALLVVSVCSSLAQDGTQASTTGTRASHDLSKSPLAGAPLSIYIDSPPDAQPIKKEIIEKLRNWGEITVVYLPERADLILQLNQSEKLSVTTGSGNRGSAVLRNRRTGEDLWSQSRGGAWSMRGWSNAWVGKRIGSDLIQFLSKNRAHIVLTEPSKPE